MSARHDDYKVDWRVARPGDPVQDGEPRSLIDSWPFLICLGIAILAVGWGVVEGLV